MPLRRLAALLALCLSAAPAGLCLAQDSIPSPSAGWHPRWATLSAGFGTRSRTAILLSATAHTPVGLTSLRLVGNFGHDDGPNESELGLLLMRTTTGRHLRAAFGAGIALVAVDDGTAGYFHPINPHNLVGLPLEAQGIWCLGREVGLSLAGFGNLNGRRAFGGLTLGLALGAFWAPDPDTSR
jgi:hypothetical protein